MSSSNAKAIPVYFQTHATAAMTPVPRPPSRSSSQSRQRADASSSTATNRHRHARPKPLLRVNFHDVSHAGTRAFLSTTDPTIILTEAVTSVLKLLYDFEEEKEGGDRKQAPIHGEHPVPWPSVRSISLILDPMDGIAYTKGLEIDDEHKEIHVSLPYISDICERNGLGSEDLRYEIAGVIVHEMVHCWQYNAKSTCPGGLIEGVADWVRLRAGFGKSDWDRNARGDWDEGYATTGFFLDWLEEEKVGSGCVRRINRWMQDREYDEERLWREVCGDEVKALWKEYKKWLKKRNDK